MASIVNMDSTYWYNYFKLKRSVEFKNLILNKCQLTIYNIKLFR